MQKTYFATEPEAVSYLSRPDGKAEVHLRRNIEEYETDEGDSAWMADEVFVETYLSEEEVTVQFDNYFIEEPETTIADLKEYVGILTQIILEG